MTTQPAVEKVGRHAKYPHRPYQYLNMTAYIETYGRKFRDEEFVVMKVIYSSARLVFTSYLMNPERLSVTPSVATSTYAECGRTH